MSYPIEPQPILDFDGRLKGRLLGPRIAFWEIADAFNLVEELVHGNSGRMTKENKEVKTAHQKLTNLIVLRSEALNETEWELLVVDYFKAQGAHVDESKVGGSQPIIDFEAKFDLGEFGDKIWRVQVKRLQNKAIGWDEIEHGLRHVGGEDFCFVSVFGFTPEAEKKAEEWERTKGQAVRLLNSGHFATFILGTKLRPKLRQKLGLIV